MTLKDLRKAVQALGMTLRWTPAYGEYRVNFAGGQESTAYYTSDRQDALDTARRMAAERS